MAGDNETAEQEIQRIATALATHDDPQALAALDVNLHGNDQDRIYYALLIHEARSDFSRIVKFSYTGTAHDGGYYAELTRPRSDLPATTTVSGPGCYAYQVDGTTFSTTVVFSAVLDNSQ
jgi:hypothetical protein